MIYLLDANVVSDLARGVAKVQVRLKALGQSDRAVTCTVVVGEVAYGVQRLPIGRRRAALDAQTSARPFNVSL